MRFVFCWPLAPNDANAPQFPDANPTGMLGLLSSKVCLICPSRRCNRFTSPHAVFHVPKSVFIFSTVFEKISNRSSSGVPVQK
jgi:hypothetical protein